MKLFIAMVMSLLTLSCVALKDRSPVSIAYSSLETAEATYTQGLGLLGDLYRAGKISDAEVIKIVAFGHQFKAGHMAASIALEVYVKSPSWKNQQEMDQLLTDLKLLSDEFKRMIYGREEIGAGTISNQPDRKAWYPRSSQYC